MKRVKFYKLLHLFIFSTITFCGLAFGNNEVFHPVTFDSGGKNSSLVSEDLSELKTGSEEKKSPDISDDKNSRNNKISYVDKTELNTTVLNNPGIHTNQKFFYDNLEHQTETDIVYPLAEQQFSIIKNTDLFKDGSRSIDIYSVVNMAISWHPAIKRSVSEVERSKESIKEAHAAYYPSLSMGIKTGLEQNDYGKKNDRSNKLTVVAEQMIYDFGKTEAKVSLNELNTIYSEYELEKDINDIAYQAVNAYLQVVKYKQLIEIANEQLLGFTKINEIAKKRTHLGASAESDYSQSKVRLASSVSQLNDYKSQYNRWSATLNNLVNKNVSGNIIIRFPDKLQSSCSVRLDESLSSPMIRIAESQVNVARKQIELANSDHYPTISLNPFYEYEIENKNNNNYSDRNKDKFGVYLNVKAPLYQGGAISSRVRQAEQALYAANNNLENEYTNAWLKISEASSQIENAKLSLRAKLNRATESIRTRDLYMLQYEQLGTRSFTDLISAESEIHQTKIDIVNSEYNIISFSVECLYQTGALVQHFAKF